MAARPQTACASGRFRPLAWLPELYHVPARDLGGTQTPRLDRPSLPQKKTWIRELIYMQHVVYILHFEEHPIPIEHPLVVLDEFNIQLSIMTWCNRILHVLEMSLLVRQRQLTSALTGQLSDKDI